MQILVNSKKLKVTTATRQFIASQVERLTKLHKSVSKVHVYIESIAKKKNDTFATAATFAISIPGKTLIVKNTAADISDAVVGATDSAIRQLRKTYEKRLTLKRQRLAVG